MAKAISVRISFLEKISCQVSPSNTLVIFLRLLSLLGLLGCVLFLEHEDQTLLRFDAPIRQINRVVAELHFDLEDTKKTDRNFNIK